MPTTHKKTKMEHNITNDKASERAQKNITSKRMKESNQKHPSNTH
jgi:hypothetical protein